MFQAILIKTRVWSCFMTFITKMPVLRTHFLNMHDKTLQRVF